MRHESFRNSDSESQPSRPVRGQPAASGRQRPRIRFTRIEPEHVQRIVGKGDAALFGEYFADALAAGWAKDTDRDRIRLAALFFQVAGSGATNPGAMINAAWKRRDSPAKGLKLTGEDEDKARALLRPPPVVQSGNRAVAVVSLQPPATEFTAADLAAQQARRVSNLRALAGMAR